MFFLSDSQDLTFLPQSLRSSLPKSVEQGPAAPCLGKLSCLSLFRSVGAPEEPEMSAGPMLMVATFPDLMEGVDLWFVLRGLYANVKATVDTCSSLQLYTSHGPVIICPQVCV